MSSEQAPNTARFTIHVPYHYPDGEAVPPAVLESWEKRILEIGTESTSVVGTGADGMALRVITFDAEDGYRAGPEVQNLVRLMASELCVEGLYMTWSAIHGSFVEA